MPVGGLNSPFYTFEGMKELILPAITLGTASAALIARMTRSSMLEVIRSDYIRTAKAKGVRKQAADLGTYVEKCNDTSTHNYWN